MMAITRRVSDEEKTLYRQEIKISKDKIEEIKIREKNLLQSAKDNPDEVPLTHLTLVDEMLNLAECQFEIDAISKTLLNIKNEEALNEGRKTIYKGLIYLESVVTDFVDAPFSDYEEKLAKIASFDAGQRFGLIEKIEKTITLLKEAYGDNTKWKWSFVDIEGRFAAVAKNMLDLKKAVLNTDPRSPDYEPTVFHLRKVKELLKFAADRHREKYEMSTNIEDFQKGINFLRALFRIHALMGERNDAAEVKKKHAVWASKLQTDIKGKKVRS